MSGPAPELLAWLALRRVRGGGVAKVGTYYLDRGLPIPGYLADPLTELTRDGLAALGEVASGGLQRVTITPTGRPYTRPCANASAAPIPESPDPVGQRPSTLRTSRS